MGGGQCSILADFSSSLSASASIRKCSMVLNRRGVKDIVGDCLHNKHARMQSCKQIQGGTKALWKPSTPKLEFALPSDNVNAIDRPTVEVERIQQGVSPCTCPPEAL